MNVKTLDFIKKSTSLYGTTKFDYTYTDYNRSRSKVTIICKKHDEKFEQTPDNHLQNHNGCKTCHAEYKRLKHANTTDVFISQALLVHSDKYDYSHVDYINNKTKINIKCSTHGMFTQTPNNHINLRQGCPHCFDISRGVSRRMSLLTFISKARQVHGEFYNYSEVVYTNTHTQVTILCKKHGAFNQSPSDHIYSQAGCPKCMSSKGENIIRQVLLQQNVLFVEQKTFDGCRSDLNKKLRFDFFSQPTIRL